MAAHYRQDITTVISRSFRHSQIDGEESSAGLIQNKKVRRTVSVKEDQVQTYWNLLADGSNSGPVRDEEV